MILAAVIITFLYSLLMIALIIGFGLVTPFHTTTAIKDIRFSIIIPFRNEAEQLPKLLQSIAALKYPTEHYEFIFVDDASEDASGKIIQEFLANSTINFKILPNTRTTTSPKKDAIDAAIQQASFDWIVTTDADCLVPEKWLQNFNQFIKNFNPKLIVGPVTYTSQNTLFERFQHLDFLSLMGSTIGGFGIHKPFLCNGANLCYDKHTFLELEGFKGNTEVASGDDIFLLEKMVKKYPHDVHYLKSKEAIVTTKPQPTFKQLINQRARWAAKSTAYNNTFSKLVSLVVLAMNVLILILLLGFVFGIISWSALLIVFGIKFCLDFIVIFRTSAFYNQSNVLKYYPASSVLYPLFIMFVIINSFKSGYSWKGRTFKK